MFFKHRPLWFFFLVILVALSIPKVQASEKSELLETISKAHNALEKKCLENIRVEESVEVYVDGKPTPGRSLTFLGTSNAFLLKTSELAKDEKSFHERVSVTRPDGKFVIAKRPNEPYVLGGASSPKSPIETFDHSFFMMFPFYSLWTGGKVIDLLSAQSTSFKVLRKDADGIEIEISRMKEGPKSPFILSPMQIVLDEQTYALKSVRGRQTISGRFITIDADYKDGFPNTITFKGGPDQGKLTVSRVHKFPIYRTEAISKSEFSLGKYGIPEPNPDFQGHWFSGWRAFWLLGAGLLLIIVVYVLRHRVHGISNG